MWKYIITAIIWTYHSLPQCKEILENGATFTCCVSHGKYTADTVRIEFTNRADMKSWIKENESNEIERLFGLCNSFKIDSVRVKK